MKWQGREVRLLKQRTERRSYTRTLVGLLQNQAVGSTVQTDPGTTAALEIAARAYGHGLATAKVEPEPVRRIITPSILNLIG